MRCVLFAHNELKSVFSWNQFHKISWNWFHENSLYLAHSAILSWWMLWKNISLPLNDWELVRQNGLLKYELSKLLKMSMQKKKNYAQEIHEPRWRRKKERFTLLFYLSKKNLLVLPCMFHWYSWTRINDTNFHI